MYQQCCVAATVSVGAMRRAAHWLPTCLASSSTPLRRCGLLLFTSSRRHSLVARATLASWCTTLHHEWANARTAGSTLTVTAMVSVCVRVWPARRARARVNACTVVLLAAQLRATCCAASLPATATSRARLTCHDNGLLATARRTTTRTARRTTTRTARRTTTRLVMVCWQQEQPGCVCRHPQPWTVALTAAVVDVQDASGGSQHLRHRAGGRAGALLF